MNPTTADYRAMLARLGHKNAPQKALGVKTGHLEGDLHDQIMAECRRRLWPVVHSRMDMATTTDKGVADFVIFADAGRVLIVECKSATGKLTPAQIGWRMLLERNGHDYHVVRSMGEFMKLVA